MNEETPFDAVISVVMFSSPTVCRILTEETIDANLRSERELVSVWVEKRHMPTCAHVVVAKFDIVSRWVFV